LIWIRGLPYGEVPKRDVLVSFPQQNCSRRMAAVKRIEEVTNAGRSPDVLPLHFWEAKLTAFNHRDEFFN